MEGINSWAAVVTICAVIACIVEIMTSNTKTEKSVRMVLGIFMLCAVIVPIADVIREIGAADFSSDYEFEASDSMREAEMDLLCSQLKDLTEKTLSEKDIYPLSTDISIKTDDTGSIESIYADITLDRNSAQNAAAAEEIIRTELGFECSVKTGSL